MQRRLLVFALTALLVSSCAEVGPGSTGRPEPSLEGSWHLVSGTTSDGPLRLLPGHEVTLEITGERASGRSACNIYSGDVLVDGDRVRFRALGSTEMACEPAVMVLEQHFLTALSGVDSADLRNEQLRLTGRRVTLKFQRQRPVRTAGLALVYRAP